MNRRMLVLLAIGVVGCGPMKPVVYQNEKYQQVGQAGVERDIEECEALANQAGATEGAGKGGEAARSAGTGAVAGAAAGAVGGAISGGAGTGAAAGAASGVVAGLLWPLIGGANRPSDAHMNYVNQCLTERGYQVTGWK